MSSLNRLPLLDAMELRRELAWSGLTPGTVPLSRKGRRRAARARAAFADHTPQIVTQNALTDRSRSPAIWSRLPLLNMQQDPSLGGVDGDDFPSFGGTVTANVGTYASQGGVYKSYEGTSATITQKNTTGPTTSSGPFGVVDLHTPASASITCAMERGYGNGGSFEIVNNNLPSRVAFEARVQWVTTAGIDTFIGLAEKGVAANQFLINSSDALQQKSFIGFNWVTAAAGTLSAQAGLNGSAAMTAAGTQAVTAATWYKLGWLYDSTQPNTNTIQFFVNNQYIGGYSSPGATGFPTGVVLTPAFLLQSDATGTAAHDMLIDWWHAAVYFQG